jgi:NitT/TauT family transport system permease protein
MPELRPDRIYEVQAPVELPLQQRLSFWVLAWNHAGLRKALVLACLAALWEGYAIWLDNQLLFPTLSETLQAWWSGWLEGPILLATWSSLQVLLKGYLCGMLCAALFTAFATATRLGSDVLETLTAMFNPLPSIALLPLAMIWFGLGEGSIVFVLIHAVLWAVALNTHAGFRSVSTTWRMVGQNYGLSPLGYVLRILIPGAFPSILTGLKIGWAFAWRTLIAAELVFGASSGQGGLGWYIFQHKNMLDVPNVFAGLLTVILIGLLVENLIFKAIEKRTVVRWGMQN